MVLILESTTHAGRITSLNFVVSSHDMAYISPPPTNFDRHLSTPTSPNSSPKAGDSTLYVWKLSNNSHNSRGWQIWTSSDSFKISPRHYAYIHTYLPRQPMIGWWHPLLLYYLEELRPLSLLRLVRDLRLGISGMDLGNPTMCGQDSATINLADDSHASEIIRYSFNWSVPTTWLCRYRSHAWHTGRR